MTARPHLWVAPPLDGAPTGGTLYNAALLGALSRMGLPCGRIGVEEALIALSSGRAANYWVDTLHLAAFRELSKANVRREPIRLVVHYLPALLALRGRVLSKALGAAERHALDHAHGFLVPSTFAADLLTSLGVIRSRIAVVQPGVFVGEAPILRDRTSANFRAIVVANLSRSKGLVELFGSLARALPARIDFRLSVVGSSEMDEDYAAACRRTVDEHPELGKVVVFRGALSQDAVHAEMRRSDVMVSSSSMETYGMALAEARALGLPIVATRGGNVESLVDPRAGGAVFDDTDAVAEELVRLAKDSNELERRRRLAVEMRLVRSWDEAAADFLSLFANKER